jgi:pyruvate/2-oxoglutarate dehydrogenase complex dihydrolipoamide acyltransferase (E2) component
MKEPEYTTIRYPAVRQFTADTGRLNYDRHFVRALLEVDVTDALQRIKKLRAPGRKVSFLAWFIKVTADTVRLHPPVSGVHKGRSTVLSFNSVNISTVVEKAVNGVNVPLPLVLRGADRKTFYQITDEIQAAVSQPVQTEGNYVLGKSGNAFLLKLAAVIPQWLRLWAMRTFILGNPQRMQNMMGTVMITSLGTVGRISGWIIPTSIHPLNLAIGSLNKKPAIHDGEIQKRDILHLTIGIDHDVIDGMPAFKFVDDLVSRLEAGEGLD